MESENFLRTFVQTKEWTEEEKEAPRTTNGERKKRCRYRPSLHSDELLKHENRSTSTAQICDEPLFCYRRNAYNHEKLLTTIGMCSTLSKALVYFQQKLAVYLDQTQNFTQQNSVYVRQRLKRFLSYP
mmetsp:Transcript_5550/g.7016  ORF Transcript_5550/g.7016 Transcript_5550/m.7016 type:complete len:128 (+) Transcript_5550:919-1302(+)